MYYISTVRANTGPASVLCRAINPHRNTAPYLQPARRLAPRKAAIGIHDELILTWVLSLYAEDALVRDRVIVEHHPTSHENMERKIPENKYHRTPPISRSAHRLITSNRRPGYALRIVDNSNAPDCISRYPWMYVQQTAKNASLIVILVA